MFAHKHAQRAAAKFVDRCSERCARDERLTFARQLAKVSVDDSESGGGEGRHSEDLQEKDLAALGRQKSVGGRDAVGG